MLNAVFRYQVKTNKEFRDKADSCMEEIVALHKQVRENPLQGHIDCILAEKRDGWWQLLSELMHREENQIIIHLSDKLQCLEKLFTLGKEEQNVGQIPTLSKFSSLDEMQEVYQQTVFFLRRMELGIAEDSCKDFLDLLKKWELSVEYILMVLEQGPIYNVQNAGNRLITVLTESGYIDYGKAILKQLGDAM